MIVNTQTSEEVKFRNRLERSKEIIPWELRWRKIIALFRGIKQRIKRDVSVSSVMMELAMKLKLEAAKTGAATILKRADFMLAISHMPVFEGFDMKLFNAVYGVFDPLKKNIVRFVEIIKSIAVIDKFEDTAEEKLMTLWDINMEYGQDMSPFDIAVMCLCNVCGSDADYSKMKGLFKTQFRPTCYRMSINASKVPGSNEAGPTSPQNAEKEARQDPNSPSAQQPQSILKTDQVMSAMPAYNIIDNFLNRYSFVKVVRACLIYTNTSTRCLT